MKIKKIITSALIAAIIFTSFAWMLPTKADAAHSSNVSNKVWSEDYVKGIVNAYSKSTYENAQEMFAADYSNGYLDYYTDGAYAIYVNRYTGVMYYRNNTTGEMLTTNHYSLDGSSEDHRSQLTLVYAEVTEPEGTKTYYSSRDAAERNQIKVSKINGGLRVNYTLGDVSARYLAPSVITAEDFEQDILKPMYDMIYEMSVECFGEDEAINFFTDVYSEKDSYIKYNVYEHRRLHRPAVTAYRKAIEELTKNARKDTNPDTKQRELAKEIYTLSEDAFTVFFKYNPRNPNQEDASEIDTWGIPIAKKGVPVYDISGSGAEKETNLLTVSKIIKKYCTDYTFEMMYADEEECGVVVTTESKPVFRLSLEYTLNDDGSLSVRLPSNSISFDETRYIVKSVTPIKFFGAGDFEKDGYFFLPDGSGSIIEFEDFRNGNVSFNPGLSIYGNDYCYSEITGAYRQQVTMPVYGISSEVEDQLGNTHKTGFFAILEEGASMAELNVDYTTSFKNAGAIYSTMTPYPVDKYTGYGTSASGGSSEGFSMVAESKYTGSYVTRYVMLSNTGKYDGVSYAPTYVGMAEYYRNYLSNNGVLTELDSNNISEDLPLYIEALGSMDVIERILTFPITVSKPITKFDDVMTMYDELSDAKKKLEGKAEEYQKLADEETKNKTLKEKYEARAEQYRELSEKVDNITNVKFKLTGFSNGGMFYTYPSKVKWERVVGGSWGFRSLVKKVNSYNDDGYEIGIYPDFDFQYVNNTAMFDGIGKRDTMSRYIDNRYASKQEYSPVTGSFSSMYAMIVSPDVLDKFYTKFEKKYSKYNIDTISLSTLGSDLNSNFDKYNPISRDDAQGYVEALLNRVANKSKRDYEIMTATGNIYAVKYADHILGVATDSSYYRFSSYTIPFTGMILHGYVNYSAGALNYSGSPDYDILRAIENGAAPYYVLGYRNTDLMKEVEDLNDYYSISYENWFDDIVENYYILNTAIGDIQDYKITDHKILIGERIIDADERESNFDALKNEFVENFDKELSLKLDEAHKTLASTGSSQTINIVFDYEFLKTRAAELFELDAGEVDDILDSAFEGMINEVIQKYRYDGYAVNSDAANAYNVTPAVADDDYMSKYQYVTGSLATDENYDFTDYTVDNDLIAMVTYTGKDGKTRTFILNYNIYAVEVKLDSGTYTIGKYGFAVI